MRITVIGGGPGGLYFALLTRKRRPDWTVEVVEQNREGDTFGFGVVFSDETLHEFLSRDRPSFERIRGEFAYWDDVAIHKHGVEMRCGGNGFAGLSRVRLLAILQERCREEGVDLHFGETVPPGEIAARFPIPTSWWRPTGSIRASASTFPRRSGPRSGWRRTASAGWARPARWTSSTTSSARPRTG